MSFLGKVLDLNKNLILLGKWPRSSPSAGRAFFACFFLLGDISKAPMGFEKLSTKQFHVMSVKQDLLPRKQQVYFRFLNM